MSEGEYLEHVFGVATGWLGWPPESAWQSTIPEINVAIAAKVEFIKMTTPGMKPDKPKAKPLGMDSFISAIENRKETKVYGD